jgi:hypothetical protein
MLYELMESEMSDVEKELCAAQFGITKDQFILLLRREALSFEQGLEVMRIIKSNDLMHYVLTRMEPRMQFKGYLHAKDVDRQRVLN